MAFFLSHGGMILIQGFGHKLNGVTMKIARCINILGYGLSIPLYVFVRIIYYAVKRRIFRCMCGKRFKYTHCLDGPNAPRFRENHFLTRIMHYCFHRAIKYLLLFVHV